MLLEFPAPIGKLEGIGELTSTIGELASTPISTMVRPSVANTGQTWSISESSVGLDGSVGVPLGFRGEGGGGGSVGLVVCWEFVGFFVGLSGVSQGSVGGSRSSVSASNIVTSGERNSCAGIPA